VDPQRIVVDGEHPQAREANETFEHDGCTVVGHRSTDRGALLDTRILAGLLYCYVVPQPLISEAPIGHF
jgi:hypothetical protein